MAKQAIGFIGGGNMTSAIVAGLLAADWPARAILIAEPSVERRKTLAEDFNNVGIHADNSAVAARADCLVLAVKPQVLPGVCRELAACVQQARPLIISIAAGIRSVDIDAWLGGELAIVRVMPNQPALLRRGVSGLFANARVSDAARESARDIMTAIGDVVEVAREADIDIVTAVSGSGPAYVYLLIDMLLQTARDLGLDDPAARTLAVETVSGAAELAKLSDEALSELIERVRSPGGTTAAALDSLERDDIRAIFSRAIGSARDRAVELADQAHDKG